MTQSSLRAVEAVDFDTTLDRLSLQLASTAHLYDASGAFPHANFNLLHQHGLVALTVPKALGGGGASLAQARKAISAIAKGEPSTALILVMQYLQHSRLQDSQAWPAHLRVKVAEDAVRNGALINALRVEPDLGTPARGGLPATTAVRGADGWRISGRKLYSTGSHGLSWFSVWARSDDADPLVGAWLVPKDSPGVSIIVTWDHLGLGMDLCQALANHFIEIFVQLAGDNHLTHVRSFWRWAKTALPTPCNTASFCGVCTRLHSTSR